MIQIGALCFSTELLYRADLKLAIASQLEWSTERDEDSHPIFDLYLSDFSASGKKTKMIFVSAEHSRQEDVSSRFKRIYDGMQNRILLLLVYYRQVPNPNFESTVEVHKMPMQSTGKLTWTGLVELGNHPLENFFPLGELSLQ